MPRSITLQEKHPELFVKDDYLNPASRVRIVPMEVLCLGYMRTGTASMQTALNLLGIPCCHSFSLYSHIRDCHMWIQAFDAKFAGKGKAFTRKEWDQLLAEYGAITDVPALAFWEDLLVAYPEAKVVLIERDIDRWYQSFDDAVVKIMWSRLGNIIADFERGFVGPIRDVHRRWATDWMRVHSANEMRKAAKDRYREHYALVRRTVPKDKLLEYKLSSGWGPLCAYLGKDIPDLDFPKVNETASMHEKIQIIIRRGLKSIFIKLMLYIGPFFLALLVWRYWEASVTA